MHYRVANGHRIPNLGMKTLKGFNQEGEEIGHNAQITDVKKVLLSVSRMAAAGNRVVFDDEDDNIIFNKITGRATNMRKD